MINTDIYLPGIAPGASDEPLSERATELFRFPSGDVSDGPMNLRPMNGASAERWHAPGAIEAVHGGVFVGRRSADYLFLSAQVEVKRDELRVRTRALYDAMLSATLDLGFPQLVRFWNYIPDINQGDGDAETYRQFCSGRAESFDGRARHLPAATGIGSHDGVLRVSVLAASERVSVRHLENPRQVSAYRYPRDYGPRSPSFARATVVTKDEDRLMLLSGTSSIVHHRTLHAGDVCKQTHETQHNIEQLIRKVGNQASWVPLGMRFYLRRSDDLALAEGAYREAFPGYPEPNYLLADICRRDLSMEVEGVFAFQPVR